MKCFSIVTTVMMVGLLMASAQASTSIPVYKPLTPADQYQTATPIKHLVIIYNENISFDHYFGTYPKAMNPVGVPQFYAKPGTPAVNGLTDAVLNNNGNKTNPENGDDASAPFRLLRSQAATADQNHAYTHEQLAYNDGKMDLFPKYTGRNSNGAAGSFGTKGQVMGYYDGNTVTALWNYAQHYAMSDNAYTDTYGPSTPGALEVVSGQTNGYMPVNPTTKGYMAPFSQDNLKSHYVNDGQGGYTMVNDVDPAFDVCSRIKKGTGYLLSKNIGDLLNANHVSWGGFMGGFDLSIRNPNGTTGCGRSTYSDVTHKVKLDYIPHHNWFMYYQSTENHGHIRPSSVQAIGHSTEKDGKTHDPANHEYDLNDLIAGVKAHNFPAVAYVKMPGYQDAHAGYSNPLDEQEGVVKLVNFLMLQPEWKDTAILIVYDDSDGWYDHKFIKPTSSSSDPVADQLNGAGVCGDPKDRPMGIKGKPVNGRCGPGTRIPFLVLSPYAKQNYIDHHLITQASVVKFIEDNWLGGKRLGQGSFDADAHPINSLFDFSQTPNPPTFIEPTQGLVVDAAPAGSLDPKF